jgi:hypothetical protein
LFTTIFLGQKITEKQLKAIETAAQKVLDARLEFPKSSLGKIYTTR